jgi:hypothetical protein
MRRVPDPGRDKKQFGLFNDIVSIIPREKRAGNIQVP